MNLLLLLSGFSRVWLCATPWMATHQAPPSLGFSRQELGLKGWRGFGWKRIGGGIQRKEEEIQRLRLLQVEGYKQDSQWGDWLEKSRGCIVGKISYTTQQGWLPSFPNWHNVRGPWCWKDPHGPEFDGKHTLSYQLPDPIRVWSEEWGYFCGTRKRSMVSEQWAPPGVYNLEES